MDGISVRVSTGGMLAPLVERRDLAAIGGNAVFGDERAALPLSRPFRREGAKGCRGRERKIPMRLVAKCGACPCGSQLFFFTAPGWVGRERARVGAAGPHKRARARSRNAGRRPSGRSQAAFSRRPLEGVRQAQPWDRSEESIVHIGVAW